MTLDVSRTNISSFLRTRHHPALGFLICVLLAIIVQFTGFGILLVIAGGFAGFLIKRDIPAILVTFAAGTTSWLILFLAMFLLNPLASISAWILISPILPAPQVVISLIGGIVCGVGGQFGVIFANYAYAHREEEIPLRRAPPKPPTPTEELPKRRKPKRKPKRKKTRKY